MEKKTLLAWVREILSRNEAELSDIPSQPPEDVAERLIDKATDNGQPPTENGKRTTENEKRTTDNGKRKTEPCAYAVKRNIVKSLQEIRKFAEKHDLAATMVRALLTLLAEMAIGALKGKVGEKALDALLKAFNYQQHIDEAYLRGKNEVIVREYFPEADEIPHLGGMQREDPETDSIFSMAKQA